MRLKLTLKVIFANIPRRGTQGNGKGGERNRGGKCITRVDLEVKRGFGMKQIETSM